MPKSIYPSQLRQAVDLLRYVVTDLGKAPSQVILESDSAGGTLILGVLGHLSHPHPELEPLPLSGPLKGVVMSSPWTNLYCTGTNYEQKKMQDPVPPSIIRLWAESWLGNATEDYYNYPAKAPASWWQGLMVREVLIVAGGDEMMLDDIQNLGHLLKVPLPNNLCSLMSLY